MPTFAAVDIGANSVRLKIARFVRNRLLTIHQDREVTRLGEPVFQSGMLTPQAMARTVKALRRFHKTVQKYGDVQVRVVATSALREARNSQAFLDWVHVRTGWRVEVISGLEEARLIHLGIISNLRISASPLLLIDLGGGSCELTLSARGHIRETVSLPLGAVRLTQEFLHHDPPRANELHRLRSYIAEELQRVARRLSAARVKSVVATSGTAAALATVMQRRGTSRAYAVSQRAATELAGELAQIAYEKRIRIPGIGTRRAEIIIAGAAVFAELLARCRLKGFRYSPLGLRDGVLAQMAADLSRRPQSRRQLASDRWDALLATCQRYRVDLRQALHVRALVMELYRKLRGVHRLPSGYEEWLSAAAMLHELGAFVNRAGWHRHAHYIIANSEILGYTPEQRRIIAAISRYLGSALPSAGDKVIKALPNEDRDQVPKAVALLRLARALNQGRRRAVTAVASSIQEDHVTLKLKLNRRTGADLEMWAVKKERPYFRAVFGRDLAVVS